MAELVANCPRCGAKEITFDLISEIKLPKRSNWKRMIEAFCICRSCIRSTVFLLSQREPNHEQLVEPGLTNLKYAVNKIVLVEEYISLKNMAASNPPEYLPPEIDKVFREGAACMAIGCHNAAGTMFRLCIDLATKSMLPKEEVPGLNSKVRNSLGLRLVWLFDNGGIPPALRDLSSCIKEDGNDGAHDGTLRKEDAEDLLDFTYELLERLFTDKVRLELAKTRREERRGNKTT